MTPRCCWCNGSANPTGWRADTTCPPRLSRFCAAAPRGQERPPGDPPAAHRSRPYVLRGPLLRGLCARRMQGSWNNGQGSYRCACCRCWGLRSTRANYRRSRLRRRQRSPRGTSVRRGAALGRHGVGVGQGPCPRPLRSSAGSRRARACCRSASRAGWPLRPQRRLCRRPAGRRGWYRRSRSPEGPSAPAISVLPRNRYSVNAMSNRSGSAISQQDHGRARRC